MNKNKLSVAERPVFRKALENYFVKNPEKKKSEVVNHFVQ